MISNIAAALKVFSVSKAIGMLSHRVACDINIAVCRLVGRVQAAKSD